MKSNKTMFQLKVETLQKAIKEYNARCAEITEENRIECLQQINNICEEINDMRRRHAILRILSAENNGNIFSEFLRNRWYKKCGVVPLKEHEFMISIVNRLGKLSFKDLKSMNFQMRGDLKNDINISNSKIFNDNFQRTYERILHYRWEYSGREVAKELTEELQKLLYPFSHKLRQGPRSKMILFLQNRLEEHQKITDKADFGFLIDSLCDYLTPAYKGVIEYKISSANEFFYTNGTDKNVYTNVLLISESNGVCPFCDQKSEATIDCIVPVWKRDGGSGAFMFFTVMRQCYCNNCRLLFIDKEEVLQRNRKYKGVVKFVAKDKILDLIDDFPYSIARGLGISEWDANKEVIHPYNTVIRKRCIDFPPEDLPSIYAYERQPYCSARGHFLESLYANIHFHDGFKKEFSIGYCANCNMYYILGKEIEKERKKHGPPYCRLENGEATEFSLDPYARLNPKSKLKLYGYHVGKSGLDVESRRDCLTFLIRNNIMRKQEILDWLHTLVDWQGDQDKKDFACRDWEMDIKFLESYNAENQRTIDGILKERTKRKY